MSERERERERESLKLRGREGGRWCEREGEASSPTSPASLALLSSTKYELSNFCQSFVQDIPPLVPGPSLVYSVSFMDGRPDLFMIFQILCGCERVWVSGGEGVCLHMCASERDGVSVCV